MFKNKPLGGNTSFRREVGCLNRSTYFDFIGSQQALAFLQQSAALSQHFFAVEQQPVAFSLDFFGLQHALASLQHAESLAQHFLSAAQQPLFSAQHFRPFSQQPTLVSALQHEALEEQHASFVAQQSRGFSAAPATPANRKPIARNEPANSLVNTNSSPAKIVMEMERMFATHERARHGHQAERQFRRLNGADCRLAAPHALENMQAETGMESGISNFATDYRAEIGETVARLGRQPCGSDIRRLD
jgi:hypothetical protein